MFSHWCMCSQRKLANVMTKNTHSVLRTAISLVEEAIVDKKENRFFIETTNCYSSIVIINLDIRKLVDFPNS